MNDKLKSVLMAGIKKKEIVLTNGQRITIRPVRVKELKMITQSQENKTDSLDLLTNVIRSCITEGKVDLNTLPMFEIERLYFEIWKLDRTETNIKISFVCKNEIDGKECGTDIIVEQSIHTATLSREPEPFVKLNNEVSVKMRYPNMTELAYFDINNESDLFDLSWRLVEEVHFRDQIMKVGTDIKAEELLELNEYLSAEDVKRMLDFVNAMPRLVMDVAVKCPCCKNYEAIRLKGLDEIIYAE
ncbi:TPA: hypothetical protein RQN22_001832 [Aeromonas dhakensis]|nr:hypothetical protein [Aeromonas dhakensis]